MAQQLESFNFPYSLNNPYPWQMWLNGKPWKLTRGQDFYGTLISFRSNVYIHAKQSGIQIITKRISDTEIVIQAINPKI